MCAFLGFSGRQGFSLEVPAQLVRFSGPEWLCSFSPGDNGPWSLTSLPPWGCEGFLFSFSTEVGSSRFAHIGRFSSYSLQRFFSSLFTSNLGCIQSAGWEGGVLSTHTYGQIFYLLFPTLPFLFFFLLSSHVRRLGFCNPPPLPNSRIGHFPI